MGGAEVEIDYRGVKAFLRSAEVEGFVGRQAGEVAGRANRMARDNGWGMDVDPYGSVVHDGLGLVSTRAIPGSHDAALAENAKHNTLKKALGV